MSSVVLIRITSDTTLRRHHHVAVAERVALIKRDFATPAGIIAETVDPISS